MTGEKRPVDDEGEPPGCDDGEDACGELAAALIGDISFTVVSLYNPP